MHGSVKFDGLDKCVCACVQMTMGLDDEKLHKWCKFILSVLSLIIIRATSLTNGVFINTISDTTKEAKENVRNDVTRS